MTAHGTAWRSLTGSSWEYYYFSGEATWDLHAAWKCIRGTDSILSMRHLDHGWEWRPLVNSNSALRLLIAFGFFPVNGSGNPFYWICHCHFQAAAHALLHIWDDCVRFAKRIKQRNPLKFAFSVLQGACSPSGCLYALVIILHIINE